MLQATTNPVIEQSLLQMKERAIMAKHAHKFVIIGIYDWGKPIKEEAFDPVRIYCSQHHIVFKLREFEPSAIEEDREYVLSLPAYHMYNDGEYVKTFYPKDDCIHEIKMTVFAEEGIPCMKVATKPWFTWTLPSLFTQRNRLTSKIGPS